MNRSELPTLQPYDEFNRELESNVHPQDWTNPSPSKPYHLAVIGAGTAGLVTAAGAAGLGARVALIERELMGGDCLNVGCVPSKAIIRVARAAAAIKEATSFGIDVNQAASVDFAEAMKRMRRLRAAISPNDSARRFSDLGVDMYFGQATFTASDSISVTCRDGSSSEIKFKKAVIAAGARAAAPPIPGLDSVPFLTNETLFSLTELPRRLAVIGSGPIGVEMAQAFARLGIQVFLFEQSDRILTREDPDAAAIVQRQLERDGVSLILQSHDQKVQPASDDSIRITGRQASQPYDIQVDQLLVAVGRAPNTDGLNLESIGVNFNERGVEVNDYLQTSNPRIFAAGDICSQFKFTHAADFQARAVIQNALFALGPLGRKNASQLTIPWATYTSPRNCPRGNQ